MNDNKYITICGDITDESFGVFLRKVRKLRSEGVTKVHLVISSEGGSATAAMAYFDLMTHTDMDLVFTGHATGLVASAASLIFMACDKRYMSENAWFMVHEDSLSEIDDLKVHEIEKAVLHARRLEVQWCELMAQVSKVPVSKWAELHKNETYLSKKECLKLGILDE